jgi:hypothetical protein
MLVAFLLATVPLAWAVDSSYNAFHRVYEPNQPETQFLARGKVVIPDNGHPSFEPSASLAQDLTQFAEELQMVKGALYQVALELDDEARPGEWNVVSAVKVVRSSPSLGLEHAYNRPICVHSVTSIKPPLRPSLCMQPTRANRTV